jgi:protein-disulfide isomerase
MAQNQRKPGATATGNSGFKWILIAIAVVGVAGIGYSVWSSRSGNAVTGPVSIENVDPTTIAERAEAVVKGPANATVQIVEFADYQCPGCGYFATNVSRQLRAEYVDSGRVRIEYYDYPIYSAHPHAFLAARAARCAGDQNLYWEMHDVLYSRQQEWSLDRTAPVERFSGYAQSVGADAGDFDACLQSDRHAEVVTANGMLGDQLGIRSTPTVFINGRNVGEAWSDYAAMKRLIDQALAAAPAGAAPATTPAAPATTADSGAR